MTNTAKILNFGRGNFAGQERNVADLDDGYARLSNMLLEAYSGADLTKRQFKVLLAILRRTYGWNTAGAGHYRTTAAAPQLRFDERNIHKQCVVCNQHKSGNLVPYRVELISRIGQEAVDEIESNHNRHRWTIEECRTIKAEYQQKLKKLRNSRSEVA